MPKPYDATLKELSQAGPADFLTAFDEPPSRPVECLNVDLSTVTTAADIVLGIGRPLEELFHLEPQSGDSSEAPQSLLAYNALLYRRYTVPVHSVLLLLRPAADHLCLTGVLRYASRPDRGSMEFRYDVIRLWEYPTEELLNGGLGTLPLAVLGRLPDGVSVESALSVVVGEVLQRTAGISSSDQAGRLETAAFVLTGLRLSGEATATLFQGAIHMRESATYQAILEEGREAGLEAGLEAGRANEARAILFRLGLRKFGEPEPSIREILDATSDIERLEEFADRILDASSWQELMS